MKVVEVETFVVANPPPRHGGRYFIFVKLTTDNGVSGIGEAYAASFNPHLIAKMIEDIADRFLIGENPFHIETFWRRSYGVGYTLRPDPTLCGVISSLEMACWDLIGKECNKPVYELLGGRVHEGLRAYTYLYPPDGEDTYNPSTEKHIYNDPSLAAEAAAAAVKKGFTAVKFDPASSYSVFDGRQPTPSELEFCESMVKALRETLGTSADILFGTHGQFTPSGALRLARVIEKYDPLWFEEPVPPDDVKGMARVAAGTSIPIATGERLTTVSEFSTLLESNAASIIQPNLGRCGGILQGKKIASIAEVKQALLAPHCYCGPVVAAANIQLATCTPNFLILESIEDWSGFHAEILEKPIEFSDGLVIPSEEPGLGVVLNEKIAKANPWDGEELQLTPLYDPPSGRDGFRNEG